MKKQKIKKILFPTHGIQILDFLVNPLDQFELLYYYYRSSVPTGLGPI